MQIEFTDELRTALDTATLRSSVADIRSVLALDSTASALADRYLLQICAVSPYITRICLQYPETISQLFNSGALEQGLHLQTVIADSPQTYSLLGYQPTTDSEQSLQPPRQFLHVHLAGLITELENQYLEAKESAAGQQASARQTEALQQKVLRRFRHRHMVRILWRDLLGVARLSDTLKDLSALADACVVVAEQWSYATLCDRFGVPRNAAGEEQRLIVLGMGKLGGYELNVSSDIDLICVWPEAGSTQAASDGQKSVDNSEFFRREVQRLTVLLNSVTEDAFVFRVDTRLRPFGESGPLVMNFEGLENYYLTQGRDWERYAMIKARALTGRHADIQELEQLIMPFVYRRYLDYAAFESLRDLKSKIASSVKQKGMVDNIKLGAGGIREIEFIGQAFQLVRGGRDPRFQIRPIVEVLTLLTELQLMPEDEVISLLRAYEYLRRVENGVQMMRDEQVHSLPKDPLDQARLLMMLNESDWDEFKIRLNSHQQHVSACFAALFEIENNDSQGFEHAKPATTDEPGGASTSPDALHQDIWSILSIAGEQDSAPSEQLLIDAGFDASDELLAAIKSLNHGSFYQRLTSKSQERVDAIVPLIIQSAHEHKDPSQTLTRALSLVRAVAGRSGYLQVLIDQPAALERLVTLFAESRWLANFVLRQPMVIDELLAGPGESLPADSVAVREESIAEAMRLIDADLDVQMDTLRHYRQGREMRIACAQLDGSLTLMQVSDQLSWLAESLIEAVLILIEAPLLKRHGQPRCVEGDISRETSVGVVAYGKLGGLELGFASDLDLVFVHDSAGSQQYTDGEKSVATAVYYARLAQKFVHFMGTSTPAGVLYEIDMRLRPNGSSGVLVTSIEAFANYQQAEAWTWEHQALMRARIVASNNELTLRFNKIRAAVLGLRRPADEVREAVSNMRERMRSALGNHRTGYMHLKQDAGGVADIEFIVQYLVLAHAAEYPALLDYTDNIRVLEVVERHQLLPKSDTRLLCECYVSLRERLHLQALQELSPLVELDDDLIGLRDAIVQLRTRVLG